MAALSDKVDTLGQEAGRLCGIHEDLADQTRAKHSEIVTTWEQLKSKALERRRRLDESYLLHQFLADFRDLISWVHDMKAIISADELAKDVAGAEALLERHQVLTLSPHLCQYLLIPVHSHIRNTGVRSTPGPIASA